MTVDARKTMLQRRGGFTSVFRPDDSAVLVLVSLAFWVLPGTEGIAQQPQPSAPVEITFRSSVRPLLERYCFECHSDQVTEADIDLAKFQSIDDLRERTADWIKVREMLDSVQMPPQDSPQPSDAERTKLQSFVQAFLKREAEARDGDPGPVILRRLTNAEYNYTLRDLTGVDSLDPTREFPVDGAAGEGFTNSGSAQGMSPSLVQKYLDAAKEVASHIVFLPRGIRFSQHTTRRDQTDELLLQIRGVYDQFTDVIDAWNTIDPSTSAETKTGGRLPIPDYLAALIAHRDALSQQTKTIAEVAQQYGLNAKYLSRLWIELTRSSTPKHSFAMNQIRALWRSAKDADALFKEIESWQRGLWKFNNVGQVGRHGGPTSWMEPITPARSQHELRIKLPEPAGDEIVIYLAAADLGDGNEDDYVVWKRPRIEFQDEHPPILLRDVRSVSSRVGNTVDREIRRTKQYLDAIAGQTLVQEQNQGRKGEPRKSGLNRRLLASWSKLASIDSLAQRKITGHLTRKVTSVSGYAAVNGWNGNDALGLVTNRSKEAISYATLTVPARSVVVHPSPTHEIVVAWRSPINGMVRIHGLVADADDKCGNGAAWRLENVSSAGKREVAAGTIDNGGRQLIQADGALEVRAGDVVSLCINAREKSHVCDSTHIELALREAGPAPGEGRVWELATDIVDHITTANPLADSYGNDATWHICGSPSGAKVESPIPAESALARWREAVIGSRPAGEIESAAADVETVLKTTDVDSLSDANRQMRSRLLAWKGPLDWISAGEATKVGAESDHGLSADLFGTHPGKVQAGSENGVLTVDATDLCVQAPRLLQVRLPAAMARGGEFVAECTLHAASDKGTVQLQVLDDEPGELALSAGKPILVGSHPQAQQRVADSLQEVRDLFPPAICYARIVPVDEVVTLTLFHREDDQLKRLMLDAEQSASLDRLWDELLFVSQEPLKLTVALEQISEFATQDRPDLVTAFAPMKQPIEDRAEAFRGRLVESEPLHLQAVCDFASQAWRRTVSDVETQNLRDLYAALRHEELSHEEAIRLTLARVLTSPAFLYKLEKPASGNSIDGASEVSSLELATRLSYFLWSSLPDRELRTVAEADRLRDDGALLRQTRRMLKDPRTRRLAIHFACQWLHLRDFDKNDDKNEKLYPEFAVLRSDMYEETVRFFEEMFRGDGSILDLLAADHTFVNERLAKHYQLEAPSAEGWHRVDDVRRQGRGGVLAMATFLASQSGASRTSPILRGNWVYETLLGERLPRPPAGVPQLPEEVPQGLTARQLIQRHSSVAECAKCHVRIDPFGFALEQYDAIGRRRGEQVDTKTTLEDGVPIEGLAGLREYLLAERREDVIRQFCRKLLGFALGREVMLSDEPLLDRIVVRLRANEFRFSAAVTEIVTSDQFRKIRPQASRQ